MTPITCPGFRASSRDARVCARCGWSRHAHQDQKPEDCPASMAAVREYLERQGLERCMMLHSMYQKAVGLDTFELAVVAILEEMITNGKNRWTDMFRSFTAGGPVKFPQGGTVESPQGGISVGTRAGGTQC